MKHLFLNGPQWIALRTVSVSGCNLEGGGSGGGGGEVGVGGANPDCESPTGSSAGWAAPRWIIHAHGGEKKKERARRCSSLKCFLTGETDKQTAYWIKSTPPVPPSLPVCLRPLHMHHWTSQLHAFQRPTPTRRQQLPWLPRLRVSVSEVKRWCQVVTRQWLFAFKWHPVLSPQSNVKNETTRLFF